jgi:ubiquinone/menaquinone biosynthesis C-methylase UbiE
MWPTLSASRLGRHWSTWAGGRGGPGLWLAQSRGARLIGVDFSAVAVQQATDRAALFELADRARFVVGDLAATGLADGAADAVVAIDALHLPLTPRRRPERHGGCCGRVVGWC